MPQLLKDEVQARITQAALEVFAREGFEGATMAAIAKAAAISTGNIYRYTRNKEVLFDALLDDAFVARFLSLLRQRAEALRGIADVRQLEASDRYHVVSEDLLAFCLENRHRVVILLGHAQGSRHADVVEQLVTTLVELAVSHFHALDPAARGAEPSRFILERIYRNFVGALVAILSQEASEATYREAVASLSAYHLSGLKGLFERRSP